MNECNGIFHAENTKGYAFKALIDLLVLFISRATLSITKDGILITEMNQKKTVLFRINIQRKLFKKYICKENINISVNLKHLRDLLKNIKKKDTIIIFIEDKKLGVASTQNNERVEKNSITYMEEINHELLAGPDDYDYSYNISSADLQKVRQMTKRDKKKLFINIQGSNYIRFSSDTDMFSSELYFGVLNENEHVYMAEFDSVTIGHLAKLSAFGEQIQFYAPLTQGNTLKIETSVSHLGNIEIYIKDLAQIKLEEIIQKKKDDVTCIQPHSVKKRRGRGPR
jgi:DNA polymerase III sliding clamp (beta) subunit (PCNA family)